jgi:hypothetical protein
MVLNISKIKNTFISNLDQIRFDFRLYLKQDKI